MIKAKKSLGQNFLMEFSTAQRMVEALELKTNDLVVEIGPGLGALTEILVERATSIDVKINAIEIDKRFFEKLSKIFGTNQSFNLVNVSILDWLPEFMPGRRFKVLGSIPYYITSPILHEVVRHKSEIDICVLMVQKEVGQKISNLAPDASYLSTFIGTFYTAVVVENIPKEFFDPVPKVDSAVLRLKRIENPKVSYEDISRYESFLHKGFAKPRKMLNKVFDKETLARADIDPKLRPQHLSIEQWLLLFTLQQ